MSAFQRATAWLDLGAVERNCRRLIAELGDGPSLCAVVKADGYGHGMAGVASAAVAGGATRLAVATASEAFELRQQQPEIPILVMGALTEPELEVALGARAEVSVWDEKFLRLAASRGAQFGTVPRIHAKYDSGMGRLGTRDPEGLAAVVGAAASASDLELAGIWTHFATADDLESDFFELQLERFLEVASPLRERHPGVVLHAANSAAVLRESRSHLDMVRCGVAIYGLDPFGDDPAVSGLEPALGLSSYVGAIRQLEPGDSVGYGRTWVAEHPTLIATVPIGYGDGVRRGLSNRAEVLIGSHRCPVRGTVSMDNITVELPAGADIEVGDEVVLIGAAGEGRILAEDWARLLGTINYEVTCGLSPRVPRMRRG